MKLKTSFFWPVFILFLTGLVADGANILFFIGVGSYSHRIAVWPLVQELSARGHAVTFLSSKAAKSPDPKVVDLVPESLRKRAESLNETRSLYTTRISGEQPSDWFKLPHWGLGMCQTLLNDSEHLEWAKRSKFDLVFIDPLANECGYGLAYKLKAKIIVINTAASYPYFPDLFGYSDESSWIPDVVYHPEEMTFYDRLVTLFVPLYFKYLRETDYFPQLEAILRDKYEIQEMPSLVEIERNVSLVFLNHHFAEDFPRPFPPNVVTIGGMQCSENVEKLPEDLKDFVERGSSGFIYMSFGSFAELSKFPEHIQAAFLNTLKKLKEIQFVWKSEQHGNESEPLPPNVYTAKWMPQQAILSHPKIRGFITHGGLLGIQEAICNAVPMICFPIFAEQDSNGNKLQSREIGIKLEITSVTEQELEAAIFKIINDEKYSRNMKRVSEVFKDRPEKAVETAVWWTEFVLRHQNTDFLRPGSVYQSWWKRRQLDIWGFLFFAILIAIKVVCTIINFTFHLLFRAGRQAQKDGKKLKSS